MTEQRERVVLGYVSGLHGVKGWVKVHSDTEPRDGIFDYPEWQMTKRGGSETRQLKLAESGGSHQRLIARLEGVDTREGAAELVGCEIAVDRAQLPETAPGEWYWADLVGMRVIGADGEELGVVTRIMPTGAHDVLVLRSEAGERLLPFVQPEVVTAVDAGEREIRSSWASDWF